MGKMNFLWAIFPALRRERDAALTLADAWKARYDASQSELAKKILELEALRSKIVAKAKDVPVVRAKSAAQVRRLAEEAFDRENQEAVDGIR